MTSLRTALLLALLLTPMSVLAHGNVETIEFGSTAPGSGALVTFFHFHERDARVGFSSSIGPVSIYTGILPAFQSLTEDDAPDLYELADGVAVNVELTDVQGGAAVVINGTTLSAVGDSALLGTAPTGHVHPQWQLLLSAVAGEFGEGSISFRLTTTSPQYDDSEVYTVRVTNGPLAAAEFDTAEYDKDALACRRTVSSETQGFVTVKLNKLRRCLDKLEVVAAKQALAAAPRDLNGKQKEAGEACLGNAGAKSENTMLGKIDAAEATAREKIAKHCAGSLSAEDIGQTLGLAGCRAEQMVAAFYPNAKTQLRSLTAPASQGGLALDRYFPCLHLVLAE